MGFNSRFKGLKEYSLSFCAQFVPSIMLTRSVEGNILRNFKFQKSCYSFYLVLIIIWGEGRWALRHCSKCSFKSRYSSSHSNVLYRMKSQRHYHLHKKKHPLVLIQIQMNKFHVRPVSILLFFGFPGCLFLSVFPTKNDKLLSRVPFVLHVLPIFSYFVSLVGCWGHAV